jgi:CRP-like cAMP-binding protein
MSALRTSVPPRAIEAPDLTRFRLFDGVAAADRDAIGSWCLRFALEPGHVLVEQGSEGRELYLVAEGELEVLHREGDHEVVVNRILPGQDVGIVAMFEGGRRTASLRAARPSVVYRLRHEDFLEVFGEATRAPFAVMLRNQLRAHTEFLVAGNVQTIGAVRRENEEAKRRLRFGSFVAVLIGSVTLYAFVLRIVLGLAYGPAGSGHVDSTFITVGILLGCVAIYVPMMIKSGYPLATYGLTLGDWRRALPESLGWTAAFLGAVTLLKAIAIRLVPAWHDQPLFSFYGFTRYDSLWTAIGLMAIYSAFAPVQELIARGAMQSSLHEFLSGPRASLWAVVLSTLMFSQIHLHLTPWYAVAVFFPSLFWGAMYARQRSLLGVSISHVLIGVYVAFFLGLPMMSHA